MLSSVLRSERAIRVNITIMRAFGRMTEMLALDKDLARRVEKLEKKAWRAPIEIWTGRIGN
jgi:hypothetical protein